MLIISIKQIININNFDFDEKSLIILRNLIKMTKLHQFFTHRKSN